MNGLLLRGLETKQPIEMIYKSDSDVLTQRLITVIDVSDTHVKAYCHLRRSLRTFKRRNILSAIPFDNHTRSKEII